MKKPIFSKDLQILQVILFAVSSRHLNSFIHSGINFLTWPVRSDDSRTASFSASFFMPPTSKKLRGHIGLGLSVRPSVCLSVTLFGSSESQEPLMLES